MVRLRSIAKPTPIAIPIIPALRMFFFASSLQLFNEAFKFVKVFSSSLRICSDVIQSSCKVPSIFCKFAVSCKSFSFSLVKRSSCAASSFDCFSDSAACFVSASFKVFKCCIARAASCKRSLVPSCCQSKGSAKGCRTQKSSNNQAQPSFLFHILSP